MTAYQRMYYLVNTHQCRTISDAGRKLSQLRKRKRAEQPCNIQPEATRLPYKDND